MAKNKNRTKGTSLAKGPVALIGLALLAYGITALIFGGHSFSAHPLSGTVHGKTWLGLEVNAWSSLLFIAAGALLVFGSPLHRAAKSMSLLVGLALIAVAVLAYLHKDSALGIFAANGLTELVWLAAGVLLLVLSLLPRVGGGKKDDGDADYDDRDKRGFSAKEVVARDRIADDSSTRARADRSERDTSWDDAAGRTSEPQSGSRRAR